MKPFFVIISTLAGTAYSTCYNNTGDDFENPDYIPCASPNLQTLCCGLNRINPPGGYNSYNTNFTQDECLPNGVCQNRIIDENHQPYTSWWTSACTEKDFSKGKCLDVCAGGGASPQRITPCDGTKNSTLWCCGGDKDCCEQTGAKIFQMAQVFGSVSSTSATTSQSKTKTTTATVTVASTTSSLVSASASAKAKATDEESLSKGTVIGIGMGAAAGGIAVIAVVVWLLRRAYAGRKKQNFTEIIEVDGFPIAAGTSTANNSYGYWGATSGSTTERPLPQELPATVRTLHISHTSTDRAPPVELPSTSSPRRWTFQRMRS